MIKGPTDRKTGEIYFIRERDRKSGNHSPYVKIRMVSDTERGSFKRLEEHQTGNPRDLELIHVTPTPAPFRVESSLHQRFGPRRIRSEWFELNDDELNEAITLSESLQNEMLGHLPIIAEAKELAGSVSDGSVRADSPEAAEWHSKLIAAKDALSVCEKLEKQYRSVHTDLSPSNKADVQKKTMVVTEAVERPSNGRGNHRNTRDFEGPRSPVAESTSRAPTGTNFLRDHVRCRPPRPSAGGR